MRTCGIDRLLRIDNNVNSHDNIMVEMEWGGKTEN